MLDAPVAQELAFMTWLKTECNYMHPKPIGRGRYAAIHTMMFTHAIIIGKIGDYTCTEDRFCYKDYDSAKAALDAWDGSDEPTGWHRNPPTGRRRNPTGDEWIAP